MTTPELDQAYWEGLWSKTLRDHADMVAQRPPNKHLVAELADVPPGLAADAGCGHGADTLWLASHGWKVTSIDFSSTALAQGQFMAEAAGAGLKERITWVESDLAQWVPEEDRYDLIICLYVHMAGSVEEMVKRMARGIAPGGTLFLVGHRPVDPETGAATAAANQVQVSVDAAIAALDPHAWEFVVAEERPRSVAGTGVDAVIRAQRVR